MLLFSQHICQSNAVRKLCLVEGHIVLCAERCLDPNQTQNHDQRDLAYKCSIYCNPCTSKTHLDGYLECIRSIYNLTNHNILQNI